MPTFDQIAFNEFVIANGIVGFHNTPLTLKSGRKSHFYVNWRRATNDAYLLDTLTDHIVDYIASWGVPCATIYGVPEGATKTAVIAGLKWAKRDPNFAVGSHRLAMGRAKPKAHGNPEDRDFIGMPAGPTVVIEDTATTGGSLITTLEQLKSLGVTVAGELTLTDREEKRDDGLAVADVIAQCMGPKVPYRSMSGALSLLPEALRRGSASLEVRAALMAEFTTYGVRPLTL